MIATNAYVILLSLAASAPRFALTTSFAVALPGITNAGSLFAVMAGVFGMMLLSSISFRNSTFKMAMYATGALAAALLLTGELSSFVARDAIGETWNYLSVRPEVHAAEEILRTWTLICLLVPLGRSVGPTPPARPSSALPAFALGMSGLLWYPLVCLVQQYPLPPHVSVVQFSFILWLLTFLSFLSLGLLTAQNGWSEARRAPAALSWIIGSLLANALLRDFAAVSGGSPSWGLGPLFASMVTSTLLCCIAVASISLSVPRTGDPVSTAPDDGDGESPDSVLVEALNRLDGSELLSERERAAVLTMLSGETVRAAAKRLGISRSALGTYLSRAYGKLRVTGKQDLLRSILEVVEPSRDAKSHLLKDVSAVHSLLAAALVTLATSLFSLPPLARMAGSLSTVLGLVALVHGASCIVSGENDADKEVLRLYTACLYRASSALTGICITLSVALLMSPVHVVTRGILCVVIFLLLSAVSALQRTAHRADVGTALVFAGCSAFAILPTAYRWEPPLPASLMLAVIIVLATIIFLLNVARRCQRGLIELSTLGRRTRINSFLTRLGLDELDARIALLTALGFDARSISLRLYISPSTIYAHRAFIYQKLLVKNSGELRELIWKEVNEPKHPSSSDNGGQP